MNWHGKGADIGWALLVGLAVGSAVFALVLLAGCGGVARVAAPALPFETVSPHDYAAAEAEFAGGQPEVQVVYWTDARCQELLDRRDALVIAAATLGGITGAGGLTTVIPKDADADERRQWDLGLGISTLALGTTASALTLAARALSERYEQNCRTERPARRLHGRRGRCERPAVAFELSVRGDSARGGRPMTPALLTQLRLVRDVLRNRGDRAMADVIDEALTGLHDVSRDSAARLCLVDEAADVFVDLLQNDPDIGACWNEYADRMNAWLDREQQTAAPAAEEEGT